MVEPTMELLDWFRKQVEQADGDVLQEMLHIFAETLMDADASAACNAGFNEKSPDRTNTRNGYRSRAWDTRAGTIDLAVPKLRQGSYLPSWLLEPRRRAEKALIAVVADCYLAGVSTRRVDKLVKTLGIEGISKSQVSKMAKSLDEMVESFRNRPLDAGPYAYLWLDALVQKSREGGRIVNVATLTAIGVNADGQRCRTHFMRNLLCRVPKASQDLVATVVRSIFAQPDAGSVRSQHEHVVEELEAKFADAARLLSEAEDEILAFTSFPKEHWRQVWSNNPLERLNREIRRRTDVVGIFPNRAAVIRLVGAVLAEQHDEWQVARRYMSRESLEKVNNILLEVEEVRAALPMAS